MKILNPILEFILYPPKKINQKKLFRKIEGKTILITGATYGIGEALAYKLAGCNVHLILVARTTEKLIIIKNEIKQKGTQVSIFTANLYNEEDVDQLIMSLSGIEGGIDIFVNNAGKSIRRSVYDSLDRYHDFTRTMAINYFAPVKIILAIIPGFLRNNGQIINISAANVLMAPAANWAAYQASKAAFDNWFRCVLPELKANGVAVSSIYLPLVKTRMIEPTEKYRNMPVMKVNDVAIVICKIMINRKSKLSPWWLFHLQILSVLLRGFWERLNTNFIKRKNQ